DGRATPEGWRALGPSDVALARAMDDSLTVPTATSVRTVPAKLLEVNRRRLNRYLSRATGVRVSFTHLISWAVVRATASSPPLRRVFQVVDGRPGLIERPHVDLGIAVDRVRPDGTRTLLVPTVRGAEALGFEAFHAAYEQLVSRARAGRIGPDELSGALVTITNPGVAGTNRSVPRLPAGQAAIVGLGAIGPPAAFAGADPERLAEVGVGPVVTITCTYDHRVIQGAESGAFLALVERLLLGEDDFYGDVFGAMHAPFRPIRWAVDAPPERTAEGARRGAIQRLVNNYRVRGHLIADLDPLATAPPKTHPELDPATLGFTPWDLGRRFDTDGIGGVARPTLEELWDLLRDAYCGTLAVEYMHIQEPAQKRWIQERVEGAGWEIGPDDRRRILTKLNEAEAFERFLHTKYLGHKRFSLEGAESLIPMLDALMERAADEGVSEVIMGMSHRGRLNVLANVIGKGYGEIFREFEGELPPESIEGTGDVRYHLGAEGTFTARSGRQLRI
ncbi:MAG: 2-oxo acid dehydrogenase subunit E2, partial [Candidatus Velamenicoccus archaeovorus]